MSKLKDYIDFGKVLAVTTAFSLVLIAFSMGMLWIVAYAADWLGTLL